MKELLRKWLPPLLFTTGGALAGIAYDAVAGCSTGSCVITSGPIHTMVYTGLIGLLLSGAFGKGCDVCNT